LAIEFALGDRAPYGYAYYDPYCSERFYSVASYHQHLTRHRHDRALTLIACDVGYDGYDTYDDDYYDYNYDY
ncbi:MAG: hypothetical protein HKN21_16060, partial [Candidatus Eisenbacteria bacterium]|nr:hypothetical protein [Candidatus Eisenbacteria bacterium]